MSGAPRRVPRPAAPGGAERAPRDPGLQPERTRLAWSRTAFAQVVCGSLLLHVVAERGLWPGVVPLACSALGVLVTLAGGRLRGVGAPPPRGLLPLTAAVTTATAASAGVLLVG
ncbi:DUF202 domain-containing protein [Allostreptomyces psammosilenae]|uniref:DUF202 domain-containing protein n=1 Tax=Allostreptomyces psammosilenae TaxID=1892865 RepID=A0A853A5Q9_9ACTN|nr:DUF202 domain-containing protein [Allostreptomyces psammosilenae]NYI08184.1 hypothetical protein [Allostreptomyces psammosilenae]